MSTEDGEKAYKTVRAIFEQTWSDYYAWAPPANLSLAMTNIVASDDNEYEDPSLAFFKHLDKYTSSPLGGSSHTADYLERTTTLPFVQRIKTTTRSTVPAALGTFALDTKVETIPQYSFVIPTFANIATPENHKCAFIPILSDDGSFDDTEYLKTFEGRRIINDVARDATGEQAILALLTFFSGLDCFRNTAKATCSWHR
jgi:hypothetical protein